MFDKKCILLSATHVLVFCILGLFSFIFEVCATSYAVLGRLIITLFITGFLLDLFEHKILKSKIDSKNKAVFITGCDSGFGYHLAKRLDSRGFDVFAGCLFPSQGGGLELTETCSARLRTLHIDVTKDDDVLNAKEFVKNNLGNSKLWAVVNNAGIYRGSAVELCTMDHFKDVFHVNVFGTVRVTKAFLPLLRKAKGRLVNVNSMGGRFSVGYMTAYSMTKHATRVLTESLQQEMQNSGVKVISIDPEFFRTNIADENLIKNINMESIASLDDDLKHIYKEKHVKLIEDTWNTIFKRSSPNVNIVIDDMEKAVSAVYPQAVYQPCRNWIVKLIFYLGQVAPKTIVQSIQMFLWKQLRNSRKYSKKMEEN